MNKEGKFKVFKVVVLGMSHAGLPVHKLSNIQKCNHCRFSPRSPAVYLLALWLPSRPPLVLPAGSRRLPHDHVAVLALVGDHGLVGHRREHGLAVHGRLGDGALHGDAGGQLARGPSPVALAVAGALANQLEARDALVRDLMMESKDCCILYKI